MFPSAVAHDATTGSIRIEFMDDLKRDYGRHGRDDIAYRIDIPGSFLQRLDEWYIRSRKPTVGRWGKILEKKGE